MDEFSSAVFACFEAADKPCCLTSWFLSAAKTDATALLAVTKKLQPSLASLQKAQESEDSSEDSSDESSSEEDTVFTQVIGGSPSSAQLPLVLNKVGQNP